MSLSEVMKHQQRAVAFWEQGKHRESASEYWEAFRAFPSPTHEARYHIFHGCTTILRGGHFEARDDDFHNMRKVLDDKHEPRLFRLEAGYTLGLLHYSRSQRAECGEAYHDAIRIGEKKPKKAKQEKIERKEMMMRIGDQQQMKPMKELMDGVLKDCQKNLNALNAANRGVGDFGPEDQPTRRSHRMPVGRGGTSLTKDEFNNLLDVGGIYCDCCKRKDAKLSSCSRCSRGFYCSKECQRKQWTENGHKSYCRKEGVFKPSDLVQIARLRNRQELNDCIVRVVGPDPATEGRYKARIEGGVDGDNVFSISGKNLNHLRPFDCRK